MNRHFSPLLFCCAISLIAPLPASAEVVTLPTGLNPGDQYRLAFVTSVTTNASSADIADHNAFVNNQANFVSELAALGTNWNAIASTSDVEARNNTDTNPLDSTGVPIYTLPSGILLAGLGVFGLTLFARRNHDRKSRLPRSLSAILASAFLVSAMPASTLMAAVILPDLPPGSEYQLIFVTAGVRDATSSDIADYNAFVNAEAALNPLLPATTWHAVASTGTAAANVNAPSHDGLPVYNTQGTLLAFDAELDPVSLYCGQLNNPITFDQYGESPNLFYFHAWTGSTALGEPGIPLGTPAPWKGNSVNGTGTDWAHNGFDDATTLLPLYALSDTLTVPVPEPATLPLLGSALSAIAAWRACRRRRAAPKAA